MTLQEVKQIRQNISAVTAKAEHLSTAMSFIHSMVDDTDGFDVLYALLCIFDNYAAQLKADAVELDEADIHILAKEESWLETNRELLAGCTKSSKKHNKHVTDD